MDKKDIQIDLLTQNIGFLYKEISEIRVELILKNQELQKLQAELDSEKKVGEQVAK